MAEQKDIVNLDPKGKSPLMDLLTNEPLPQCVVDFWAETGVDLSEFAEDKSE